MASRKRRAVQNWDVTREEGALHSQSGTVKPVVGWESVDTCLDNKPSLSRIFIMVSC